MSTRSDGSTAVGGAPPGHEGDDDVLDRFSAPTSTWFRTSFAAPTPAQEGAWRAISAGDHTLVVAPTGSGKTLSAFLWSLDRLGRQGPAPQGSPRCRVVYVSPMKALAVDVERNLRSPLVGIGHTATRLGLTPPRIDVAVRSGDTPQAERRAFATKGADVLITTPESLFLLLTSAAREALAGVDTVIVDEVHAVAGTKRGAHLALTLERLDALLPEPAQRIGLSATVEPVQEVARFLAGGRAVQVVRPESTKSWDLRVVVPVPDLADLASAQVVTSRRPADDADERDPQIMGSGPVDPWATPPDDDADTADDAWAPAAPIPPGAADPSDRASIWPHVEQRVAELIGQHTSSIVFANSRRLAERLTSRLNEVAEAQAESGGSDAEEETRPSARPPAEAPGQSGTSAGTGVDAPVIARAHHGSVSKENRLQIEESLKTGALPAVVATSSLELGIDMGSVDLVVQVESPPSVASGLQRVGRAGHQVGAVSRGVFFPKHRGDLVQTAVVVERMRAGRIEALRIPSNPLDVLAQQIVAMCALDDWSVEDLHSVLRRSAPYAALPRSALTATLDMLAGSYPSEDFADLRPRVVWDRVTDTVSGRRGAQRLAVLSGGTIPDRGLFAVMLATGEGPGRRVGELDEEMVYESRVGDVFTLGTTAWRIEDITHDRVMVTPAPGQPGRLPFWKGDQPGRPAELGRAVGSFVREMAGAEQSVARERAAGAGLDEWATDNLLAYLHDQVEATGRVPDDRSLVLERFRDEIGDWRVVLHSPFGSPVNAPWALAIAARIRERHGIDVQAMAADDGIVLRLPDIELGDDGDDDHAPGRGGAASSGSSSFDQDLLELIALDPEDVSRLVTDEIGGSALFAARFRECAARALLLPRRRPDRRQPLWQQRQRSAQLLEVASRFPGFPIVLEAVRECLQDVFDVPALTDLMRDIASRQVRLHTVQTPSASPFARSLLFGYVADFMYQGDSPLAERRAAALSLDPALLADLLGGEGAADLRDLLDPEVVRRVDAEVQRLTPERAARDADEVHDLLRILGPLNSEEVLARTREDVRDRAAGWLEALQSTRRVISAGIGGQVRWAAVEDAGRLRDALGMAVPPGVPQAHLEPVEDPWGDLVRRYARTHGPFTVEAVARRYGVGTAVVVTAARRLLQTGRVSAGALRPLEVPEPAVPSPSDGPEDTDRDTSAASTPTRAPSDVGPDLCDAEVLRLLRRRSLASLRAEVEPVRPEEYARFLPTWQGVGAAGTTRGVDGVLRVVEQLAGVPIPASAWERLVLPARVPDYQPGMLDELLTAGEVLWQGHGALAGSDGWISLHPADIADLTLAPVDPPPVGPDTDTVPGGESSSDAEETGEAPPTPTGRPLPDRLADLLERGGGWFVADLARALREDDPAVGDAAVEAALWDLVWAGRATGDSFAAVRALLGQGRGAHRARTRPPRTRSWSRPALRPAARPRATPSGTPGRWSALPTAAPEGAERALARAEILLDRYGVVTRGSVMTEGAPGGFAGVYRVLAAAEEQGRVRRGYFIEHLGAAQFASTGAIDRLRADPARPEAGRADRQSGARRVEALALAATDPANPYGAALPWPESTGRVDDGADGNTSGARPGRKAGALVVLVEGHLALHLERGGRTGLTFPEPDHDPMRDAEPDSGALSQTGPDGAATGRARAVAESLAGLVRSGRVESLRIERLDGVSVLASGEPHALVAALTEAGFSLTPRGLRLRRR